MIRIINENYEEPKDKEDYSYDNFGFSVGVKEAHDPQTDELDSDQDDDLSSNSFDSHKKFLLARKAARLTRRVVGNVNRLFDRPMGQLASSDKTFLISKTPKFPFATTEEVIAFEAGTKWRRPKKQTMNSGNIFTRGLSRISRRKKKQKTLQDATLVNQQAPSFDAPSSSFDRPTIFSKGMDRLRRSLRLPKRRDRSNDQHLSPQVTGSSKQDQWQPDESAVRSGTCCFNVKYLGSTEVLESRGMQVCEDALKVLRTSRRKPVKSVLYVSGDGLRVVDQGNNRGLLVDQTIEKVSFCAPDRMNDKGFAYICRDGTSRRWMCHGFFASKETGERLSHAVGCAFAICLERKKKRDEENSIANNSSNPSTSASKGDVMHPNWDDNKSDANPATRSNLAYQSFRKHVSIEERYLDPQSVVIINDVPLSNQSEEIKRMSKPRPTSNPALFQRQGSLRAPEQPTADQFKRNLSLRAQLGDRYKNTSRLPICNEPIYEGDEDPLGLGISPTSPSVSNVSNPVQKNGLEGLDMNWTAKPAPLPHPTNLLSNSSNGNFASWPAQPPSVQPNSNVSSPLDDIQKQFEEIKIQTCSNGSASQTPLNLNTRIPTSISRSKADEWLDDVLRVSMTMSPTSNNSTAVTPSASFTSASNLNTTVTSISGPPPAHAPPPLPVRQAVSNGNPTFYQLTAQISDTRISPSGIDWNSSPNPSQPAPIPAKPIDPFDVQWSRYPANNSDAPRIA